MKLSLAYDDIQDVANSCDSSISAAETHGVLTGMLCVTGNIDTEVWLDAVFGDTVEELSDRERGVLLDLNQQTRQSLSEPDFSFEMLLPDDETDLSERTLALSGWCQGFLSGLGQVVSGSDWPGDSQEVLQDLIEISRLDPEVDAETDEEAYTEVSEFVRLGVQMIHGEFLQRRRGRRLH
jgi:uncharacterized protein